MEFIQVQKFIDELRSSGYTWEQVKDACNEKYKKNYGEAKWRKPYQAWRLTVDDVLEDESNELLEQELKRIARAKTRLEINRKIVNAQKYELHQLENKEMLHELYNEETLQMLKSLSPNLKKVKVGKQKEKKNYVFAKSDGHYNGHQNLDVEFNELIEIIAKKQEEHGFGEIIFAELGDTIDGASLRTSQLMAIKKGMVEQANVVARYYIEFLNLITQELNINVKFLCVESSNHTQLRQLGTGRSEMPMEDLMYVIAEQIRLGTQNNDRVEVISAPRIIKNINGINYLFEHGHDIKNKDKHISEIETHYDVDIDYGFAGHFHSFYSRDLSFRGKHFRNRNMTFISHSNALDDDFANRLLLSSAPSIHFSIDTLNGQTKENIILKKTIEHYLSLKKEEDEPKLKVRK